MKHAPTFVFSPLRLVTLTAALLTTAAYADDYADVSQLARNGKYSEALVKADQYLSAKPRDPQMRFIKGVVQRDSGKTGDAIATFTRLTEDFPELPEPYNNLAVLYAGQNQFDKARTALEMAIRTNPSYTTAHENLGDVYAKLASQAYGKALQLDASNTAVPPKLAVIRELFNPALAKGQRPTLPAVETPSQAAAKLPPMLATKGAADKAPPTLSGKTPAPATSTPAAATPPATTAAANPANTAPAAPEPATKPPPANPVADSTHQKDVETAVNNWAKAWAAQDMKGYLGAYGKEFGPPGKMSRSDWEAERRQRIVGKSKISVRLEKLSVQVNGDTAIAKFQQSYKSGSFSVSSRKQLDLVKTADRWLIVREAVN
ncbi:MAG: tetratricopeptide repeat protein [Rhodoferax sp.]|nr:tetratricopeptide repeat protein [Rhodoferax sp.]